MTEGLKSGNGAGNGYRGVPEEKPDFWKDIEKKYFETSPNVRDWEGFKKEYYKLEHLIKQSLDELHKFQIDFSKKITYIEYLGLFEWRFNLGSGAREVSETSRTTAVCTARHRSMRIFKRNWRVSSGFRATRSRSSQRLVKVDEDFIKGGKMENLINSLKLRQQEPQSFVKMNMLQRFKEIIKDHQNDYNRSIVISI